MFRIFLFSIWLPSVIFVCAATTGFSGPLMAMVLFFGMFFFGSHRCSKRKKSRLHWRNWLGTANKRLSITIHIFPCTSLAEAKCSMQRADWSHVMIFVMGTSEKHGILSSLPFQAPRYFTLNAFSPSKVNRKLEMTPKISVRISLHAHHLSQQSLLNNARNNT